jgi:disulfide bond formation protein DsbB
MASMSQQAAERFFALLALVAGFGALGLIVARLAGGRRAVEPLSTGAVWAAFTVTATATFGSLTFSEHFDLIPCRLCWFQRIAMFSLVVVLFVGAIRRDPGVRSYAVPLAALGMLVSAYHYLVEWYPGLEGGQCSADVPCSVPYFREFGFVTLAFMALCGFAVVLALLLAVPRPDAEGRTGVVPPVTEPEHLALR